MNGKHTRKGGSRNEVAKRIAKGLNETKSRLNDWLGGDVTTKKGKNKMPIYNVNVTLETTIVVVADDEDHAYQVARDNTRDAIENDRPEPGINIRGEVTSEKHLRDGWDSECLPYGGNGSTRLKAMLTHN